MSVVEIKEFSTLHKIRDFTESGNLKKLMDFYFDEKPNHEFDNELNELNIKFSKYPFSVTIPNYEAQMSMFFDFNSDKENSIVILDFLKTGTSIDDVFAKLGKPDFERGPVGGNMQFDKNSMIKYYIDQYSIAIDHYDGRVMSVAVFEDNYR